MIMYILYIFNRLSVLLNIMHCQAAIQKANIIVLENLGILALSKGLC